MMIEYLETWISTLKQIFLKMLAYVDIVTNSTLNTSNSQQTACSHTIGFEACLFSPSCGNTDLGQKSMALLIQAHNGSTGVEKFNKLSSSHRLQQFSDQISNSSSRPLLLFPYFHAMHCQCFNLRQLWHRSDPMVHQFHLIKEQQITLAKSKALSWDREANWLPMQTDECWSHGRRERDLTLSFQ